MKTVNKVLIKNYMKGRNTWALFRLSLGWLHIIEKKKMKTTNLLVQELIK